MKKILILFVIFLFSSCNYFGEKQKANIIQNKNSVIFLTVDQDGDKKIEKSSGFQYKDSRDLLLYLHKNELLKEKEVYVKFIIHAVNIEDLEDKNVNNCNIGNNTIKKLADNLYGFECKVIKDSNFSEVTIRGIKPINKNKNSMIDFTVFPLDIDYDMEKNLHEFTYFFKKEGGLNININNFVEVEESGNFIKKEYPINVINNERLNFRTAIEKENGGSKDLFFQNSFLLHNVEISDVKIDGYTKDTNCRNDIQQTEVETGDGNKIKVYTISCDIKDIDNENLKNFSISFLPKVVEGENQGAVYNLGQIIVDGKVAENKGENSGSSVFIYNQEKNNINQDLNFNITTFLDKDDDKYVSLKNIKNKDSFNYGFNIFSESSEDLKNLEVRLIVYSENINDLESILEKFKTVGFEVDKITNNLYSLSVKYSSVKDIINKDYTILNNQTLKIIDKNKKGQLIIFPFVSAEKPNKNVHRGMGNTIILNILSNLDVYDLEISKSVRNTGAKKFDNSKDYDFYDSVHVFDDNNKNKLEYRLLYRNNGNSTPDDVKITDIYYNLNYNYDQPSIRENIITNSNSYDGQQFIATIENSKIDFKNLDHKDENGWSNLFDIKNNNCNDNGDNHYCEQIYASTGLKSDNKKNGLILNFTYIESENNQNDYDLYNNFSKNKVFIYPNEPVIYPFKNDKNDLCYSDSDCEFLKSNTPFVINNKEYQDTGFIARNKDGTVFTDKSKYETKIELIEPKVLSNYLSITSPKFKDGVYTFRMPGIYKIEYSIKGTTSKVYKYIEYKNENHKIDFKIARDNKNCSDDDIEEFSNEKLINIGQDKKIKICFNDSNGEIYKLSGYDKEFLLSVDNYNGVIMVYSYANTSNVPSEQQIADEINNTAILIETKDKEENIFPLKFNIIKNVNVELINGDSTVPIEGDIELDQNTMFTNNILEFVPKDIFSVQNSNMVGFQSMNSDVISYTNLDTNIQLIIEDDKLNFSGEVLINDVKSDQHFNLIFKNEKTEDLKYAKIFKVKFKNTKEDIKDNKLKVFFQDQEITSEKTNKPNIHLISDPVILNDNKEFDLKFKLNDYFKFENDEALEYVKIGDIVDGEKVYSKDLSKEISLKFTYNKGKSGNAIEAYRIYNDQGVEITTSTVNSDVPLRINFKEKNSERILYLQIKFTVEFQKNSDENDKISVKSKDGTQDFSDENNAMQSYKSIKLGSNSNGNGGVIETLTIDGLFLLKNVDFVEIGNDNKIKIEKSKFQNEFNLYFVFLEDENEYQIKDMAGNILVKSNDENISLPFVFKAKNSQETVTVNINFILEKSVDESILAPSVTFIEENQSFTKDGNGNNESSISNIINVTKNGGYDYTVNNTADWFKIENIHNVCFNPNYSVNYNTYDGCVFEEEWSGTEEDGVKRTEIIFGAEHGSLNNDIDVLFYDYKNDQMNVKQFENYVSCGESSCYTYMFFNGKNGDQIIVKLNINNEKKIENTDVSVKSKLSDTYYYTKEEIYNNPALGDTNLIDYTSSNFDYRVDNLFETKNINKLCIYPTSESYNPQSSKCIDNNYKSANIIFRKNTLTYGGQPIKTCSGKDDCGFYFMFIGEDDTDSSQIIKVQVNLGFDEEEVGNDGRYSITIDNNNDSSDPNHALAEILQDVGDGTQDNPYVITTCIGMSKFDEDTLSSDKGYFKINLSEHAVLGPLAGLEVVNNKVYATDLIMQKYTKEITTVKKSHFFHTLHNGTFDVIEYFVVYNNASCSI